MSVNDLIVQGAKPLLSLDYFASGNFNIKTAAFFGSGVSWGSSESPCVLIGGETAEIPGLYAGDDCDCYGKYIGAVNRVNSTTSCQGFLLGE